MASRGPGGLAEPGSYGRFTRAHESRRRLLRRQSRGTGQRLLDPLAAKGVHDADVSFMARVLEDLVVVVALPRQHERPRSRPGGGVFDRRVIVDACRTHGHEPLDEVEVLE